MLFEIIACMWTTVAVLT